MEISQVYFKQYENDWRIPPCDCSICCSKMVSFPREERGGEGRAKTEEEKEEGRRSYSY